MEKQSRILAQELEYQLSLIVDHEYLSRVLEELLTMPTVALLKELDTTLSSMLIITKRLLLVRQCGDGDGT